MGSYIESKRPDSKPRGMTNHRWNNPTLKSFTSSGGGSSRSFAFNRPTLNYGNDKESILNNAPDKSITQNYKVAENPNPFMKDVLSMGQKYNSYQRKVANPEYNDYINKKNNEYNKKYNNFRWGNYNWSNLAQNNFENEQKTNGIFNNTGNNFMNNSATLSMAKQALFG